MPRTSGLYLIEFLHQTTTLRLRPAPPYTLYLIEFLHQTTTPLGGRVKKKSLYLIEFLHQTTTTTARRGRSRRLYLIEFLHQTTTFAVSRTACSRCILLNFYIKPQPRAVFALILWLLCPVSRLKKTGLNSAEVDLMSFFVFQRTNIAKYLRKTPTAGVYPVLPVRFFPRNSEYRRIVCP